MFVCATANHTALFTITGLPISGFDHREDVGEQHQPHLCSHQPCGSTVPGQHICNAFKHLVLFKLS